jgi:sugar transferase EpsL
MEVDTEPGLTASEGPLFPVRTSRLKRLLDCATAAAGLVVAAPLMAGIAAWIALQEGRPVLFVQRRTGLDGRPFQIYKFRTMVDDAVAVGQLSGLTADDPFGLVEDDARITRSGRLLRRTSLDELPQLVNVLRGEMSIVGPRPDIPEQSCHYSADDRRRLAARPGITGWAQVHGRDALPWPDRYILDAWYIEHWNHWLDLKILVLTALALEGR